MQQPFSFDRPQTLGALALRNGYCLAPLETRTALFDGEVSRDDCYFHQEHAQHVGLDVVGSIYVHASGATVTGSLSAADDAMIPGLRRLAASIHASGAKAVGQLVHAGRMTNHVATNGASVVAPSAVRAAHGVVDAPHALTRAEIFTIIDQFGAATQRLILAGFDGVELHGANSMLLQQFLSPLSNQRSDDFGGELLNRLRLPLLVVQRVLRVAKQAQQPFVVGYRLSPEEVEPGGLQLLDTLVLSRVLAQLPVAYLSLSLHHYDQTAVTSSATGPVRKLFKTQIGELPLMVAGEIARAEDVQRLDQQVDFLALGRQLMLNPQWPVAFRFPAALHTAADLTATRVGVPQAIFKYL
ncbi:oxidoreductase [Levilactobacillus sp. HBUAS70063]|uniref:oxidoreductase n=1 Tax=Levilactobacillus sp. HBUAS70063 TaxID=3109359 RepID=UPI003133536D